MGRHTSGFRIDFFANHLFVAAAAIAIAINMLDCIPYTYDTTQPTVFHFPCHRLCTYSDATSLSSTHTHTHTTPCTFAVIIVFLTSFVDVSMVYFNFVAHIRRQQRNIDSFVVVVVAPIALMVLWWCCASAYEVETITQTANRWYKLIENTFICIFYSACVVHASVFLSDSCILLSFILLFHSFALNYLLQLVIPLFVMYYK